MRYRKTGGNWGIAYLASRCPVSSRRSLVFGGGQRSFRVTRGQNPSWSKPCKHGISRRITVIDLTHVYKCPILNTWSLSFVVVKDHVGSANLLNTVLTVDKHWRFHAWGWDTFYWVDESLMFVVEVSGLYIVNFKTTVIKLNLHSKEITKP